MHRALARADRGGGGRIELPRATSSTARRICSSRVAAAQVAARRARPTTLPALAVAQPRAQLLAQLDDARRVGVRGRRESRQRGVAVVAGVRGVGQDQLFAGHRRPAHGVDAPLHAQRGDAGEAALAVGDPARLQQPEQRFLAHVLGCTPGGGRRVTRPISG